MTRGWGPVVLLFFAGITSLEIVGTLVASSLKGFERRLVFNLAFTVQISAVMYAVGVWMYFLSRRSLAYFHPDRLPDLLVTPLRSRDLWPGVLMGPVTIAATLAFIAQALKLLIPFLAEEKYYLLYSYLLTPSSMSAESLYWIRVIGFVRAPVMVVVAVALSLAYGTFASACVLPDGGPGRLIVVLILAQVLLVPEILTAIWVDNSAVLSNAVGQRFQLISDHISGPMVTVCLAGLVYLASMRLLCGPVFHSRIKKIVDRP